MRKLLVFLFALCLTSCVPLWAQNDSDSAGQSQGMPAPGHGPREGRHGPGVAGTITAINNNSISVKTMDGQAAQVSVSDKTEFRKDRQPAKLSDFKVGDMIFVRGEQKDGIWQAEMIGVRSGGPMGGGPMGEAMMRENLGKRFIIGEVKSISGTQLTIQRPDGVTQTISVDESTSFRKDNESITLADIKAGDKVFGRGELKNDVFVPAVLNLGEPRFMRGGNEGPAQK